MTDRYRVLYVCTLEHVDTGTTPINSDFTRSRLTTGGLGFTIFTTYFPAWPPR